MGPVLEPQAATGVLDLTELPIFHGLSVLSRALGEMVTNQGRRDRGVPTEAIDEILGELLEASPGLVQHAPTLQPRLEAVDRDVTSQVLPLLTEAGHQVPQQHLYR